MKYTKEAFLKLTDEVVDFFRQPTADGKRLPAPAIMLIIATADKITHKLFDGEEEIEIIAEEKES